MECYDCDRPAKLILSNTPDSLVFIPLCKEHAKKRSYQSKDFFGESSVKDGDVWEEIFEKKKVTLEDEESKSNRKT